METVKPPAKITDTWLKTRKASSDDYRVPLGNGLYLEVRKTGRKVWRYRANNVAGTKSGAILLTLGDYPDVLMSDALRLRDDIKKQIKAGIDPREESKNKKRLEIERKADTVSAVTYEWLQDRAAAKKVSDYTIRKTGRLFEMYIFPTFGNVPIDEVTPRRVLDLLKTIAKKSTHMARLVRSNFSRLCSYAVSMRKLDRNPVLDINSRDVLPSHVTVHHKALQLEELPLFLQKIEETKGYPQTKAAMMILIMLFMRVGECCVAEWRHIDLEKGLWTIPAGNTKMKREQVYPLPRQVLAILKELKILTGNSKYVFSSGRKGDDYPMSYDTITGFKNRCGFYGKMTVHGLRATAASWLDEQGYNRAAIERQLSHLEKGQTNQAYHRANFMEERRVMLQHWADYIDSVRIKPPVSGEALQADKKAA